jgi:hypothetical protein
MSTFWKEVIKEKDIFDISINKKIENGNKTLFWKDRWFSDCSLQSIYLVLHDLALNKNATVAQVIGHNKYYLIFTRSLNEILRQQLHYTLNYQM